MLRIGVDIGGTFTDFAAWRESDAEHSKLVTLKVPSTPPTFADGFRAGLDRLLELIEVPAGEAVIVGHGTTVGTNTVLERSGPPVAALVTRGFRDIFELQRLRLPDAANLFARRAEPFVPRSMVYEIDERIASDGQVQVPIDLDAVADAAVAAVAAGAHSIAVAFLHSYRNPVHERLAAAAIRAAVGDIEVNISGEIWPRVGEYERALLCALDGYIKQATRTYLEQVERHTSERLPGSRLYIMQSNGGAISAREASEIAVQTLLSGPAAGVTAAEQMSARGDRGHLLTLDMGGTSTDVAMLLDGRASVTVDGAIGDLPLMMPMTSIETVGAGGGSIARLDSGVLRVGPQSAGARPGPACFGHGGALPTLTDAFLVCGYLNPSNFLGGSMQLDGELAERALGTLVERMGAEAVADAEMVADACVSVATATMAASVMPYLARFGVDPEDLTLVTYGGNGSIQGPLFAAEIGIDRIVVPRSPSVFCAVGAAVTDLVRDLIAVVGERELDVHVLEERFAALEDEARRWLAQQMPEDLIDRVEIERWADMRYVGQSFNVAVALTPELFEAPDLGRVEAAFRSEHERLYAHADAETQAAIAELRVRIRGILAAPATPDVVDGDGAAATTPPSARRTLRIAGQRHADAPVYERAHLRTTDRFSGPAVIEQPDATIVVPDGFEVTVRPSGEIVLERGR